MIQHRVPSPTDDDFADRFRAAVGGRHHRYLDDVASYLLERIVTRQRFENLDSIIAYCQDPRHLSHWLPSEADRILVSDGLVSGLRKIAARAALTVPNNAHNKTAG